LWVHWICIAVGRRLRIAFSSLTFKVSAIQPVSHYCNVPQN
jgi:hypothetical protein